MRRAPAAVLPAVSSAAVYAVPLVGPHAAYLVGEVLWRGTLREPGGARALAFQWGAALLAQALLFLVLLLLRRTPLLLRAGAFAAGWLALALVLNAVFLVAIPVATLIEPETRPERLDLVPVCAVPAASLFAWQVPPELAQQAEALLRPHPAGNLRRLRMPGCQVADTAIPETVAALSIRSGGRALFGLRPPAATRSQWMLTDAAAPRPVTIPDWEDRLGHPMLLADGRTLGFVRPRQSAGGYRAEQPPWADLLVQDAVSGARREIPIGGAPGRYALVDGAGLDGPFLLTREGAERAYLTIDAEGRVIGDPSTPQPGVPLSESHDHWVWRPDGWLAWDVYAEAPRRCAVEWRLAAGAGRIEIPRGSCVTSAALDPGGRYVAYSTASGLSVGATHDSVVVVRVTSGDEVYRRYFPKYHRSEVALLGERPWFALTEIQGPTPLVQVYALPAR